MTRHCQSCRHANTEWAQYCAQCGAPIEAPPIAAPTAVSASAPELPTPAIPGKPRSGRRLMWIAIVLLMGMGWFWVVVPPSRRQHTPRVHVSHDAIALPAQNNTPVPQTKTARSYRVDNDLADAVFALLRPSHVPIVVTRLDDDYLRVKGTTDEIAAIDRFVDELRLERHHFKGKSLETYQLPSDQAAALESALNHAKQRIHVRRDGSTLRVRGTPSLHEAIRNLIPFLRPQMQSMVDISEPRRY